MNTAEQDEQAERVRIEVDFWRAFYEMQTRLDEAAGLDRLRQERQAQHSRASTVLAEIVHRY